MCEEGAWVGSAGFLTACQGLFLGSDRGELLWCGESTICDSLPARLLSVGALGTVFCLAHGPSEQVVFKRLPPLDVLHPFYAGNSKPWEGQWHR